MKTVLVDCLTLNGARSGYLRIIGNLLYRIHSNQDLRYRYVFLFQRSGYDSLDKKYSNGPYCSFIIIPSLKSKWVRGGVEQIIVPLIACYTRADLIFMPCTFGLAFPSRPTLTFVHTTTSFAMNSEMRGRGVLQQHVHNALLRMTARTSCAIVFTTQQTMSEFMTYTNCDPNRGCIIGNGILQRKLPVSDWWKQLDLSSCQYLLTVSQIYRLKNFDTLIQGFRRLKETHSQWTDLRLVIVGTIQEPDYYAELITLAGQTNDIVFFNNLSDADLDAMYSHATLYCQMSYFEGYSLTPAEALMHGVPALISDIPTHREVYGNLVRYADPYNKIDLALQLSRSLNEQRELDSVVREQVALRFGFERFFIRLEVEFDHILNHKKQKMK